MSIEVVHSKVAMISMPPPADLSAFDSVSEAFAFGEVAEISHAICENES